MNQMSNETNRALSRALDLINSGSEAAAKQVVTNLIIKLQMDKSDKKD